MKILEASGIAHDTESNFNFVDLNEPVEQYARPVFPHAFHPKLSKQVRYFRKVLIFRRYIDLLGYIIVDENSKARLRKVDDPPQPISDHMLKKYRYLIDVHATKSIVKKLLENRTSYDGVYKAIRNRLTSSSSI